MQYLRPGLYGGHLLTT